MGIRKPVSFSPCSSVWSLATGYRRSPRACCGPGRRTPRASAFGALATVSYSLERSFWFGRVGEGRGQIPPNREHSRGRYNRSGRLETFTGVQESDHAEVYLSALVLCGRMRAKVYTACLNEQHNFEWYDPRGINREQQLSLALYLCPVAQPR